MLTLGKVNYNKKSTLRLPYSKETQPIQWGSCMLTEILVSPILLWPFTLNAHVSEEVILDDQFHQAFYASNPSCFRLQPYERFKEPYIQI